MLRRPVSIHDVARRAGVSITTVSFALNGTGTISDRTRERVRAIADEMNYRANALARGLRRAPLGAIGFVTRPLDEIGKYRPLGVDVFARTASAAASAALDHGLGMLLLPDLTRSPLPPLALSLDGYIVQNPVEEDPVLALLRANEIPYVTIGEDPSRPEAKNWISRDEAGETRRVLDRMRAAGASQIAFIGGAARDSYNLLGERGYLTWCGEQSLEPLIEHAREGDGVDGGRDACGRLLGAASPDGVFCLTSRHAAGVLGELRSRGFQVPQDVLLAAGSDSEHARAAEPAISSLEVPAEAMGAAAVEMLVALMGGEQVTSGVILPTAYRERASTQR